MCNSWGAYFAHGSTRSGKCVFASLSFPYIPAHITRTSEKHRNCTTGAGKPHCTQVPVYEKNMHCRWYCMEFAAPYSYSTVPTIFAMRHFFRTKIRFLRRCSRSSLSTYINVCVTSYNKKRFWMVSINDLKRPLSLFRRDSDVSEGKSNNVVRACEH